MVALVVALVAGCVKPRSYVRFGALVAEPRSLDYKPGIAWWTLPNKLKVAVLPDDRANLVSVDVRYQVGAAAEPAGKTGLAHLVEHIMFQRRTEPAGPTIADQLVAAGLSYNGYTNLDQTHYITLALASHLDDILALEARRMAIGCTGLDQATLEHERAIVLAEIAQRGTDAVYGPIHRDVFGAAHAYGHSAGGEDVATLTLADVCQFIDAHYAPSQAILVVSGRIPAAAIHGITTRFGAITHRAVEPAPALLPVAWNGRVGDLALDVEDPTVLVVFPSAPWGSVDWIYDQLIDRLIGQRLARLTVDHDWILGMARVHLGGGRGGGRAFALRLRDASRADDAIAKIYEATYDLPGRYDDDLVIALASATQSELLDAFESFATRGQWCADFLQYTTHGQFQLRQLTELQHLDPAKLRERGRQLRRQASRALRVLPNHDHGHASAQLGAATEHIDMPVWQATVDPSEAERPLALPADAHRRQLMERRLANGMRVVMLPDFRQPVFEARLVFPVDETTLGAGQRGVASAAAEFLEHDFEPWFTTKERRTMDWVLRIGAPVLANINDHTTFRVHGFSLFADCHLWRLHWLLENGTYERRAVAHSQNLVTRDTRRLERGRARRQALREALFGPGHPYAQDTSPIAALSAAGALTPAALKRFRDTYYRASGATLILAGNFDPDAMATQVTDLFGAWAAAPPPTPAPIPAMQPAAGPTWIGDDVADATQIRVTYAFAATSPRPTTLGARAVVAELVRDRVEQVRSRLGASYGIHAGYALSTGGDTLEVDGFVDASRAGAAVNQLQADLAGLRTGDARLAADFVRARRAALARALGDPIRSSTAADELEAAAAHGLPIDAAARLPGEIAATTLATAREVIAQDLQAARAVVVLSGQPRAVTAAFAAAKVTRYRRVADKPDAARLEEAGSTRPAPSSR